MSTLRTSDPAVTLRYVPGGHDGLRLVPQATTHRPERRVLQEAGSSRRIQYAGAGPVDEAPTVSPLPLGAPFLGDLSEEQKQWFGFAATAALGLTVAWLLTRKG